MRSPVRPKGAPVTATAIPVEAGERNEHGYTEFRLGGFTFRRDEHFAHIDWPTGRHVLSVEAFLKALMRDVAWNFFYGIVNFDAVIGTMNHYGTVDLFAGRYNDAYRKAELDHQENFDHEQIMATFKAMLADWTNDGFDPFAAPQETGSPYGEKRGDNLAAVTRTRVTARRMVGVPGDEPLRSDETGHPVNRMFADVAQDKPTVEAEPGYEQEVAAFNLFAYLSRSDVTWNPSVVSVCKDSLYCPTTEEFILPIIHGNDRVEWFVQLSDVIHWKVEDRETGAPRANVVMKAGDVAAMPADIRHQGYSPKRAMLLVWENGSPALPDLIAQGKAPKTAVEF
jgi:Hydroquinone 1,2-dioxygenase large subunit N-terminal